MCTCKFCGKFCKSKNGLTVHIKKCPKNPEGTPSKKTIYNYEKELRRQPDGSLKRLPPHKHSEETKRKISKIRKEWLSENKDKHVWKKNSKFVSIPCENFKSFLKSKNINFVEEYEPFQTCNYCIDIAWPDEKIGIEINGNQHYNRDGSLKKYYSDRHLYFENNGWKIFEIHYTKCYNINIEKFEDILNLPIYDKEYVGVYFSKKEKQEMSKKEKELEKIKRQNIKKEKSEELYNQHKKIIENLIYNSGIDFSKYGWSGECKEYLRKRNELFDVNVFKNIKKFFPEFLKQEFVFKRKGSIY